MKIQEALLLGTALIALLSGCSLGSNQSSDGWSIEQSHDDIKNIDIIKAVRQFAEESDPKQITRITVSCNDVKKMNNEMALQFEMLSLKDNGNGSNLDPAKLVTNVSFRIDGMPKDGIFDIADDKSQYVNEMKIPFISLLESSQGEGSEGLSDAKIALASNGINLDESVNDSNRTLSNNFRFPSGNMYLSYDSEGGVSRKIKFSFADKELVQVASACGWHQNPPPLMPANPSPISNASPIDSASEPTLVSSAPASAETNEALAPVPADQSQSASIKIFQPSFDCAKSSTGAERLICGDAQLAKADADLMADYRNLIRTYPRSNLKQEQRNWLRQVRDRCSDVACMLATYKARKKEMIDNGIVYAEQQQGN